MFLSTIRNYRPWLTKWTSSYNQVLDVTYSPNVSHLPACQHHLVFTNMPHYQNRSFIINTKGYWVGWAIIIFRLNRTKATFFGIVLALESNSVTIARNDYNITLLAHWNFENRYVWPWDLFFCGSDINTRGPSDN